MRGGLAVWRGVAGGAAGVLGDRLGFAEHEALGDQKALSRGAYGRTHIRKLSQ